MIVTYTPKGQEPQTFEYDSGDVRAKDAELMETKSGIPWENFGLLVMQGMMKARRVLLWHLLRETHPSLRLDDVDFAARELKVEFNAKENKELRDVVVSKSSAIPAEQREAVLAQLDADIAKAEAEEAEGKALSAISDETTA